MIDECTGYTELRGKIREMVAVKPGSALNLNEIRGNFSPIILRQ